MEFGVNKSFFTICYFHIFSMHSEFVAEILWGCFSICHLHACQISKILKLLNIFLRGFS
jgi:hypothetical protein